jgi:hypothetical protein
VHGVFFVGGLDTGLSTLARDARRVPWYLIWEH